MQSSTAVPPLRVLLAGGGSGGSAAPVIAVAEAIRERSPRAEFLYVGTRTGPEAQLARAAGLHYVGVPTGRLRRYLTWRNLTDPALVMAGLAWSLAVVRRFRPVVGFGAGGFATVPVLVAARMAGARVAIHQQDVRWGLANRMLLPFASDVTVAFQETAAASLQRAATVVGNPVRRSVLEADPSIAHKAMGLDPARPLLLATGGGTGAAGLNESVLAAAPALLERCQIMHLVGGGKSLPAELPGYHQLEFVTDLMAPLLHAADVVLTRAGMSSLAELAALRKASIVVPMPASHQEANAAVFGRRGAAIILQQASLTAQSLATEVMTLLGDESRRTQLGQSAAEALPTDAAQRIAERLLER